MYCFFNAYYGSYVTEKHLFGCKTVYNLMQNKQFERVGAAIAVTFENYTK